MFWRRSKDERALIAHAKANAEAEARRIRLQMEVDAVHTRIVGRALGHTAAAVAAAQRYEMALAALDQQIAAAVAEAEFHAKLRYKEWLLDREKRKKYFIQFGVNLPVTPLQAERDRLFSDMQRQLESRQAEFQREADRIARADLRRLEHERQDAERARAAEHARADALALERERIAAEKEAVARVAQALAGDFA